jgi:hypothetical protein
MEDRSVEQAILWPSKEHYPRFKEICGDDVVDTYEEFAARAQPMVDELEREGFVVVKVDFDPDDMAAWCMQSFGKINSTARASYVAMLALGEGSDTAD